MEIEWDALRLGERTDHDIAREVGIPVAVVMAERKRRGIYSYLYTRKKSQGKDKRHNDSRVAAKRCPRCNNKMVGWGFTAYGCARFMCKSCNRTNAEHKERKPGKDPSIYPYITGAVLNDHELVISICDVISRRVPEQARPDVAQEIILDILTGS